MSINYKKNKKNNFVDIVIIMVCLVFCFPILPLSLFIAFALYLTKIKVKYLVGCCIIVIPLTCIFLSDWIQIFVIESIKFTSLDSLFETLFSVHYTFYSWCICFIISFCMATYLIYKIQIPEMYKNAGVTTLDEEVIKINNAKKEDVKQVKPHKTDGILLGIDNAKKEVFCMDNAKHAIIGGTTGSGKTVLLLNFIKRAVEQNFGALIIDGKGDNSADGLKARTKELCAKYGRDLYIIDMTDPINSASYNPFKDCNETIAKDMLINMSEWSEQHYKLNMELYLQRVIKTIIMAQLSLDFNTIVEYINPDKFVELSSDLEEQEVITKAQHLKNLDLYDAAKKIAKDAAARFMILQESTCGQIFDAGGIDIYTSLINKAVILFVLNPLEYPETSSALGKLVLIDSKKAVSKLFAQSDNHFFVFDELNVYVSETLVNLLNKSRSAGVTCICAVQSLADLKQGDDDKIKEQILENCNNYLVMRENTSSTAEEWAKMFGTKSKMKMTYKIGMEEDIQEGSIRESKEFIVHPDEIKNLKLGEAFYLCKDSGFFRKVKVNKPF